MWRVVWNRLALDRLAGVWLGASDQNAVTAASHQLDQALAVDPENEGESRPNEERVTFASPLGIRFKVYTDRRLVRVLDC